ncbi:bifunctional protein HldE [beta proteobacterium KB13]|uniref:Bifunctional protein HldE n=1 Tax=beta proteobacterium KB13 TaxID=314607 RepID=B6BWS7_9PROT|nr:bifunctional protein HldE [beta proteobacterium KB13]
MNKLIFNDFLTRIKQNKKNILVIGDVMLDQYFFGSIDRISPEAPVPVFSVKEIENKLGGAANVVNNIINFGVKTSLISSVAKDKSGEILLELLKQRKITSNIIFKKNDVTTTKIRSVVGSQQLLRQDFDAKLISLTKLEESKIINKINKNISVIILSDYGKGFLSPALCQKIISKANKENIPVLVDPKGNDISKYKNAFAVTPNKKEALSFTNMEDGVPHEKTLNKLRKENNIKNIIETNGENGINLYSDECHKKFPAVSPKQVFDVSGAGDSVISSIAASLYAGFNIESSLTLANIAAGTVISKIGTEPVSLDDLRDFFVTKDTNLASNKIFKLDEMKSKAVQLKKQGKTIGFTNGCFDILHSGHVSYLNKAKKNVDFLILGLNTDHSIKKIKGSSRPIVDQQNRAQVLSGLSSVDAIVFFNENTPIKLIKTIQPHFLIKGNDYKVEGVVGHKEVKKWAGKVMLIDLIPGQSSTNIIKKINHSEK